MYDVIKIAHLILHFCTLFSFYSFCIIYFLFSKIIVNRKDLQKYEILNINAMHRSAKFQTPPKAVDLL